MRQESSEQRRLFYARFSEDELGGLKWDYGITAVLMDLDPKGDVWRFVGVDDEGKPVCRWPSRRPPPFDFACRFPETSVFREDLITAAEFEAKWAEAAAFDEGR